MSTGTENAIWVFCRRIKEFFAFFLTKIQGFSIYRKSARLFSVIAIIKEADKRDLRQLSEILYNNPNRINYEDKTSTFFIGVMSGKIVGYVELVRRPESELLESGYWLIGLNVSLVYRGMGLGERLTRAVIEKSKKEQAGGLRLRVFEDNIRAIKLYRKLGFQTVLLHELDRVQDTLSSLPSRKEICMIIY